MQDYVEPQAGMPILWEPFQDNHLQQFESAFDGSEDVPSVLKRIVRQKVDEKKPEKVEKGKQVAVKEGEVDSMWKDADFQSINVYQNWGVRFDRSGKLLESAEPFPQGRCAHAVKYPPMSADEEFTCAGCGCSAGKYFKDDETTHADDTRKRVDFLGGDKTYLKTKRGDPKGCMLKNAMRQQEAMFKKENKYTHPLMDWCDRFRASLINTEETSLMYIPIACAPVKGGGFGVVEDLPFPKLSYDFDVTQKIPILTLFDRLATKIYDMEEVASYEIIKNRSADYQGNVKPCELSGDLLVLHQTGYPDLITILNAIHGCTSVPDHLTISYNAVRRVMGYKTDEKSYITFNVNAVKLALQRKLKTLPPKIQDVSIPCIMDLFIRTPPLRSESELEFKTRIVDMMLEIIPSRMPAAAAVLAEMRSDLVQTS